MLKFKSKIDTMLFCIDLERYDLLESVTDTYVPTDEMVNEFIKRRREMVGKIKDFRKSQQTKQSWRKYRNKYMNGIKGFHKSTDGKRFHRNLARFLVSRITDESIDMNLYDFAEVLKSLSSLPTHLLIELQFYHPLEEQATYEEMLDEVFPIIYKTLDKLYYANFKIDEKDMDFILRLIDTKTLISEIAEKTNKSKDLIKEDLDRLVAEDEEKSYLDIIKSLL